MAKDKKKSIYDYELKDINKDGKKNFADTWLGDALGFDGKLGTQGPGMKESMKGSRRKMGGGSGGSTTRPRSRPSTTSTSGKSEPKMSSRLDTKGETPKREPKMSSRLDTKGETPARKTDSGVKVPSTSTSPKVTRNAPEAPKAPKAGGIEGMVARSNERQANARASAIQKSKSERANTPSEAQIQSWIKNKLQTDRAWAKKHTTESSRREAAMRALGSKSGLAKGGMVKKEARYEKKGNRDYKQKGMFYKSASPKGFK